MAGFSVEHVGPPAERMAPAEAASLGALWEPVRGLPADLKLRRPLGVSLLLVGD